MELKGTQTERELAVQQCINNRSTYSNPDKRLFLRCSVPTRGNELRCASMKTVIPHIYLCAQVTSNSEEGREGKTHTHTHNSWKNKHFRDLILRNGIYNPLLQATNRPSLLAFAFVEEHLICLCFLSGNERYQISVRIVNTKEVHNTLYANTELTAELWVQTLHGSFICLTCCFVLFCSLHICLCVFWSFNLFHWRKTVFKLRNPKLLLSSLLEQQSTE